MNTKIVLTGILKDENEFLIVKRNENDDLYPGAWEFPGGHLEIDFIINIDKSLVNVKLSDEHSEYKWVTKDSKFLGDFIKDKLLNVE